MEILSESAEQTKELAVGIARNAKGGEVFALYGNLGSGKTTFTQGFVEALEIHDKVVSPTFVLIRHYKGTGRITKVNHVDLYRITDPNEVLNLGILDMLGEEDSVTLIEWPEVFEKYLPKSVKKIRFEVAGETKRKIIVED